jgi:hypothetical protein
MAILLLSPFFFCCVEGDDNITFHYNEEEEDDSFRHLFQWFCCKKMATCAFFGDFFTKKAITTMLSPSFTMEHVKMAMACDFVFFCFFFVLMV